MTYSLKTPQRPLLWSDTILDLRDFLTDDTTPVYIVGGAVRDAFLQRPLNDIDLATPENAVALGRRIANSINGDFYIMDAERDVARVILNTTFEGRVVIDIARLRGADIVTDLQDRDFTFNAMAVDLKGDMSQLIDPLEGESDLIKRIIRQCSAHAITDDPVRALRGIRQSIQFKARIEPETLASIRAIRSDLLNTSPERIRDELFKLLGLPNPVSALRIADKLGLLGIVLPEIIALHDYQYPAINQRDLWEHSLLVSEKLQGVLRTISPFRTDETAAVFDLGMIVMSLDRYRQQLQAHIDDELSEGRARWRVLLLAALLHDTGKTQSDISPEDALNHSAELVAKRAEALRLSNAEKQLLVKVVRNHTQPLNLQRNSKRDMHRYWYTLGETGVSVILLALADYLGTVGFEIKQDEWVKILEHARTLLAAFYDHHDEIVSPTMLVDGNALMEKLNLEPGPMIGELLDAIREEQAVGEITTEDEALTFASNFLQDKR
ncbi:MAG: HD domain-containing protein [Aggregatilineales bacterium]